MHVPSVARGVVCHDASSRFKFLLNNQLLKFLPELHFVLVCCQLASPARIAGRCIERRGQGGCAFDGSRRLTALGTFAFYSKLLLVESINFRSKSRAQHEGPCVDHNVRAHARSTGADGFRDIRRRQALRRAEFANQAFDHPRFTLTRFGRLFAAWAENAPAAVNDRRMQRRFAQELAHINFAVGHRATGFGRRGRDPQLPPSHSRRAA